MRRSITMLLALGFMLIGADALQAQQDAAMRIGLKGGINFADFEIDDADDPETESRKGFIGGAYLTFRANQFISFQPEVLYSQVGTVLEETPGVEAEFKLAYIQVPLLARFNFAPGSFIRPHLALGPYVAFNIDCDIEFEIDGASDTAECKDDDDPDAIFDAESTDWGGVFGGGLSFVGSRGTLTLDGRYNLGLADVFEDDDAVEPEEDAEAKNRFWSLMIGFSIPFGGM